jgi:rubrerythrin
MKKSLFKEAIEKYMMDEAGPVGKGFAELVADIKNAEELGAPKRREMIADFVSELKTADTNLLDTFQVKLNKLSKDAAYAKKLQDVIKELQSIDEETLTDFMELRDKLQEIIKKENFDNTDTKRHFIDTIKMKMANVNDTDLKKLYDLEQSLIGLVRLV